MSAAGRLADRLLRADDGLAKAARAALLVSASVGPLAIAGALGVPLG